MPREVGRTPDREDVERIAAEEAAEANVKVASVLGQGGFSAPIVDARRRAIRRIVAETGCSARGLAKVWGLNQKTVRTALERDPPPSAPYDQGTYQRLVWCYGPARAQQIVSGRCPKTQRDLRAWRTLIAKGARA